MQVRSNDLCFSYKLYRFGFVTYAKLENVDDCLRSGPHKIDERDVDVKRAVPKPAGQEGDSDFPRSSKV